MLEGLPAVLAAWIVFGVAHTLARLALPSQLAAADALSMMAAQSLALGYQPGQPPLFDWSVWLVQQATGPTALSIYLTKYAFMTADGVFVYWGTLTATRQARLATLASLSLMLLFNVGVSIHDQSTHSVALIAAMAASFHFYAMIAEGGDRHSYMGLGIAMGAGALAKYGYLIMPVSFALAFLYSPRLRTRIVCWDFAAAAGLATLIVLPFAWWLSAHGTEFTARAGQELMANAKAPYMRRVVSGLMELFECLAVYSLPAVPVLLALFPQLLLRGATRAGAREGVFRDTVGLALVIGVTIAIALVFVTGVDMMRSRYMHVLALLLPVYAVMHLRPGEASGRRLTAFLAVVAIVQAATVVPRALTPLYPDWPLCTRCAILKPIDALADALAERGFARATILAGYDLVLGGNLRRALPDAQIRSGPLRARALPARDARLPCIEIAEVVGRGPGSEAARLLASPGGAERITVPWSKARAGPERATTWVVKRLPEGTPRCRG